METLLTMSQKELTKLEVMKLLEKREIKKSKAATLLGLSCRQARRLWYQYRQEGAKGLISKKRGKLSNNRLNVETKDKVIELIGTYYSDFGPTLAHEKLIEKHGLNLSVESVRKLMTFHEYWKPKQTKRMVLHQLRERRSCLGELIQIDGSPHDWFEGRSPQCTLLAFIDDATGRIMGLRFVQSETMFNYFEMLKSYIQQHGKPVALYSDKHGIFRVNMKESLTGTGLTQFGRAAQALGIGMIHANTPQAKGRIERLNQTLQDRLVKEMRLRNIHTMEEANRYLSEFIEDFNYRFAVVPKSSFNAHRPLSSTEDLSRILSIQETRTLSKNLMFSYKNVVYQIQRETPSYMMRGAKVFVLEDKRGQIRVEYKWRLLEYRTYHEQEKAAPIACSKQINIMVDRQVRKLFKPSATHPWRKWKFNHNITLEQQV